MLKSTLSNITAWITAQLNTQPRFSLVIIALSLIGLIVIAFWWQSRVDWLYPEQPRGEIYLETPFNQSTQYGQSFMAQQAGLQGVGIKLHLPSAELVKQVNFQLYTDPTATTILRQATASTQHLNDGDYLYFKFQPLSDSRYKDYYFNLQITTQDSTEPLILYLGSLETYVNGAAYINQVPFDGQIVFWLNYNRQAMLFDTVERFINSLPTTLLVIAFLLLPATTVFIWLPIFRVKWLSTKKQSLTTTTPYAKFCLTSLLSLEIIEWIAILIGFSLSLYPLFIALLRYLPFALSSLLIKGIFIGLAIFCLFGLWKRRAEWDTFKVALFHQISRPTFIGLIAVLGLSWLVRLAVIQGIDVPLWSDAYHHTLISQIIVDNGKLVNSWQPYSPLQSISYHFGFHAMVAMFHWLTGLTVVKSVLVFGQILNFLAVLMAYLLGKRLGGNAWIGLFAALITGLISQYPMFYVNWGRYTQLAGQILLPPLIVLTWILLKNKHRSKVLIIFNILLVTGLALTHYRVIIFYPCFVVALLLMRWYQANWHRSLIIEDIIRLSLVACGTLILIFPRALEILGGVLWKTKVKIVTEGSNNTYFTTVHNTFLNIYDHVPPLVILLAWLGLIVGSWQRKITISAMGIWWVCLLLVTNPHFLGLPGSGLITNFAINIGGYLIFSFLVAIILGQIAHHFELKSVLLAWVMVLIVLISALFNVKQQTNILDKSGMLVTRPDLRAMTWIKEHTALDTKFLVNARLSYGGWTVAGTDAGRWLPFFTGRQNTAPPLIYGLESPPYPEYMADVYYSYQDTRDPNLSDEQLAYNMRNLGLTHIYIGQQRGTVWQGNETPLDPTRFIAAPMFNLVYAQDGVRIFELVNK